MTTREYNELLRLSRRYILAGRNYYKEITPEDLVSETLLYIADNNIEELNRKIFWECLIKTRSKMVKDILTQTPQLRKLHYGYVQKYRETNLDQIRAKQRVKFREWYKEHGKERYIRHGKVGAPVGEKHGKFIGFYHTPKGTFESSYSAASELGVSARCIQYRCKSNNDKFKEYYIKQKDYQLR